MGLPNEVRALKNASENTAPAGENTSRWHNLRGYAGRISNELKKRRERKQNENQNARARREHESEVRCRRKRRDKHRKEALSPKQSFLRLIAHHELIVTILLAIVSAGVTLLIYSGVSLPMTESGAGIVEKGHALSFSIVIGVLSWIGWSAVFTFVPRLTGRRLALGLSASTAYILLIAAISTPMNMLALAGPAAMQMGLVEVASHYEERSSGIFDAGIRASQLVPALRAHAARFSSLEQQEIETGAISGSPKPGAVSASLGQVSTILTSLADSIDTGVAGAGEMKGRITVAIATLKQHVYTQGDIRERSAAVAASADTVDELLSLIGQYDFTVSIAATAASLDNLFPSPDGSSSGFEKRQDAEIAIIGEMAKPVAQSLRDALGETKTTEVRFVRPMNAMEAIRHFWWPLLPQWVAAIFTDIAPAFLLLIYLAARREAAKLAPPKDKDGDHNDR